MLAKNAFTTAGPASLCLKSWALADLPPAFARLDLFSTRRQRPCWRRSSEQSRPARHRPAGFFEFSHWTNSSIRLNSFARSRAAISSSTPYIGSSDGSFTSDAKSTARQAASGRRAHHRCNVPGCPCRIDFSRAAGLVNGLQAAARLRSAFCGRVTARCNLAALKYRTRLAPTVTHSCRTLRSVNQS